MKKHLKKNKKTRRGPNSSVKITFAACCKDTGVATRRIFFPIRGIENPTAPPAVFAIMDTVSSAVSCNRAYAEQGNIFPVWFPAAFLEFPTVQMLCFHNSSLRK
ncbi:MAG: hypothetical protein QTN59_07880 [Candidatus Electrothrix communis]|nr:hypothetical protein [Desulfobulbus sp. US4]WLE98749.1 MAG: hypothetical protein QTN59_07880 [Candidatus Electrothrix communis]